MENRTTVKEFLLVGFRNLHHFRIPFFILLTITYSASVAGNLLICALVSSSHHLQSAMYFFLGHLSLSDILISSTIAPNALKVILEGTCTIPVRQCAIQLYFYGASVIAECCLLTVMSYDRYLAICKPLHYSSIMRLRFPHYLVIWCWVAGFGISLIAHVLVLELDFCGPNVIDHFLCDVAPLLELACSDITNVQIEVSVVTILLGLFQFFFVLATYVSIFKSIFRISSITGRQKTFSTCSAHLTVVSMYYGTLIILYVAPTKGSYISFTKVLSLLNSFVTPLFNPIIYSLRNKEIHNAVAAFFKDKYF